MLFVILFSFTKSALSTCANGCNSTYDGSSWTWEDPDPTNLACYVPSCNYNYGSSSVDSFNLRSALLNQILTRDWNNATLPQSPNCDTGALKNYDSGNTCAVSDPCNKLEGLYCMGMVDAYFQNCLRNTWAQCLVCKGLMIMDVCTNEISTCPTGYISISTLNLLIDYTGSLTFCVIEPTQYSSSNYQTIYVQSEAYPGIASGTGSSSSPYLSLYYAFTNVYASYTKIILSAGSHYYAKLEYLPAHTPLIINSQDPLRTRSFLNFESLWITGDSSNRPVVYWRDLSVISSLFLSTLIENLVFRGDQLLNSGCVGGTNAYCFYCPNVQSGVDDHGNYMSPGWYNTADACSVFSEQVLFSFKNSASFSNVDFLNFRQQFRNLIFSQSSLSLSSVNFQEIQPRPGGSVIQVTCSNNCDAANFQYSSGTVTGLNDGYEDSNTVQCGNFFSASNFSSIAFDSVTFTFNFVMSNENSRFPAKLLYSVDHRSQFSISNCVFDTNFVQSLIYIDVQNLKYDEYYSQFTQTQFVLENTLFQNIYAYSDFVTYLMKGTLHNIIIKAVTVNNIVALGNGVFYIVNSNVFKENYYNIIDPVTIPSHIFYYDIPNPVISIQSVVVSSIVTGNSILQVISMPIVNVNNFSISNVADGSKSNVQKIINLFTAHGNYMSGPSFSATFGNYNCTSLISLSNILSFTGSEVEVFSVNCVRYPKFASIFISNCLATIMLSDSLLSNIISSSELGCAVTIIDSNTVQVSNLSVLTSSNWKGPSVFLESESIVASQLNLTNLFSAIGSGLYIQNFVLVTLEQFVIKNSISQSGNGACLSLLGLLYASSVISISISEGLFLDCHTGEGNGGGIFLDTNSKENIQNLHLMNLNFTNCQADDGSALFISENIQIGTTSLSNFSVENNFANYSTITDNHYSGVLYFNSIVFSGNTAIYAGISTNYHSSAGSFQLTSTSFYNFNSFRYVFSVKSSTSKSVNYISIMNLPDVNPNSFSNSIFISNAVVLIQNLQITGCLNLQGVLLDTSSLAIGKCDPTVPLSASLSVSCLLQIEGGVGCNSQNFYVNASSFPGVVGGNGTVSNPFYSLYFAFTKIDGSYVNYTLSPGTHYYAVIDLPKPTPVIPDLNDPLGLSSLMKFITLWITGDSYITTTVYWVGMAKISSQFQNIYIKNIVFRGDKILRNDCDGTDPYCYYCPIITQTSSGYIDQHLNFISQSEYLKIPSNCSFYSNHILFEFNNPASFYNVTFLNFRHQFENLIYSEDNLNLTYVNFTRNQPKSEGSVVNLQCTSGCNSVNFGFINGFIGSLNDGYEDTSALQGGNFFTASGTSSFYFSGLNFEFNMAVSYTNLISPASLIYIVNHLGTITILNCTFEANYVQALIFVDVSSLKYSNFSLDASGQILQYSQTHFTLKNCNFYNSFSSVDFIRYTMYETLHNIVVDSVNIKNILAAQSGVFYISNLNEFAYSQSTQTFKVNNTVVTLPIPNQTVRFSNVSIFSSSTGNFLIETEKLTSASFYKILISNVSDANSSSAIPLINLFKANHNYLSLMPSNSNYIFDCKGALSFSSILNLTISSLDISSVSCSTIPSSQTVSVTDSISYTSISNFHCHDLKTSSSGNACLYISGCNFLSLANLSLENISNGEGSLITFSTPNANLQNLSVKNSISVYGSGLFIEDFEDFELQDLYFSNVTSIVGDGACVYLRGLSSSMPTQISLINGFFQGCNSTSGNGGALNFDSATVYNNQLITISNISITNCFAFDGSALFLTSKVVFNPYTTFAYISIYNNIALLSIISDNHYAGRLTLNNMLLRNNTATYAGLKSNYLHKSDLLSITNSQVYEGESAKPVFVMSSLIIGSNVSFVNVSIHDINTAGTWADGISVAGIYLVVSGLSLYNCMNGIISDLGSTVSVYASSFHNVQGQFISAANGVSVTLAGSSITQMNSAIFSLSSSNLTIMNIQFDHISNGLVSASGGSIVNLGSVTVDSSSGIINSVSSSSLTILNSHFFNINGGFISSSGNSYIVCNNSLVHGFKDNLISSSTGFISIWHSVFYDISSGFMQASGGTIINFVGNSVQGITGVVFSQSGGVLNIQSCNFTAISNSMIETTGATEVHISSTKMSKIQGAIISASSGSLTISDSVFSEILDNFMIINGGISVVGTNLNVTQVSNKLISATFSSVQFFSCNFFDVYGGFISADDFSTFLCDFCSFSNFSDTIISMNTNSMVSLSNSIFENNVITTFNTAIISITSRNAKINRITSCTFRHNTAVFKDLFLFTDTFVYFDKSYIGKNFANSSDYAGVGGYSSSLVFESCIFESHNSSLYGAFVYALLSDVTINFTTMSNGISHYGGAVYLESSNLFINHSSFSHNSASQQGGSIYSIFTDVKLFYTSMLSGVSSQGSEIFIAYNSIECYFDTFESPSLVTNQSLSIIYTSALSQLIISECNFNTFSNYLSALISVNSLNVAVQYTTFANLFSFDTGAVTLLGKNVNGVLRIFNTTFQDNFSTGNGSALYTSNLDVSLAEVFFLRNHAKIDGGAIYFEAPNCPQCNFQLSQDTKIVQNSCMYEGGAIKWKNTKPVYDDSVVIENNTALYGGNFASLPASVSAFHQGRFLSDIVLEGVAPGQNYTFPYLLYIYDTYGNVINSDNKSVIQLSVASSYSNLLLSGKLLFTATNGTVNISDFIPYGPPGTIQNFLMVVPSISPSGAKNDDTVYNNTLSVKVNLRNCTYGEQIGTDACIVCPEFRYLIYPDYICLACPNGATCLGGKNVIPNAGYWRSSNFSSVIYQCPSSYACLGSNSSDNWQGTCSKGYTGIKCSCCEVGFTKSASGSCNLCPSPSVNYFIMAIYLCIGFAICVVIVKSSIKSAIMPKSLTSIYIKIFTNYLQLTFLTSQFEFNWPYYLISFFSANNAVANSTDALFSIDCLISPQSSDSALQDVYFTKLALYTLLPFAIFFISLGVWTGVCFLKETYKYLKREFILTCIIVFFLVYPNIMKSVFANFTCENVDLLGLYLASNYNIKCWTSQHTKYTLLLSVPCLVIWIIGMPFLLLVIMIKRRRNLSHLRNRVIFGFFFNGYKTSRFYWEFVIIIRKLLMILVSVLSISLSISVQGLTIVIILMFFVMLQYRVSPYTSKQLNLLEVEGLVTATLTLYCGVYFITNNIGEAVKVIFFVIIILGNGYFLLMWVYWMAIALIDLIIKSSPSLKHLFKKGDAYDDEFYVETIQKKGSVHDKREGARKYTFFGNQIENQRKSIDVWTLEELFKIQLEKEENDITKDFNRSFTPTQNQRTNTLVKRFTDKSQGSSKFFKNELVRKEIQEESDKIQEKNLRVQNKSILDLSFNSSFSVGTKMHDSFLINSDVSLEEENSI